MLYEYQNIRLLVAKGITIIIDYLAILLGLLCAYHVRLSLLVDESFTISDIYFYLIAPLVFLSTLLLINSYDIEIPLWERVKRIFSGVTIGIVTSIVLMYAGHVTNDVSRLFVGFSYILVLVFILVSRFGLYKVLISKGFLYIPVLLVGASKTAELVKRSYDRMPLPVYRIIGYLDDNPKSQNIASSFPYLKSFTDIESTIEKTQVKTVLICTPGVEPKRLVGLINRLQVLVKNVSFVPDMFGIPVSNISARGLMEEQAVILRIKNNLARKSNRVAKRIFDIVATVCGGFLILPIMVIVAILIYVDLPGPIVFGHKRVGQRGKEFSCYKFRSMAPNVEEALDIYLKENPAVREEWERDFKLKDDPRVTRIGKFLRKTSLDELLQLWNVFIGDMSLVGPRPIVRAEIPKYGDYINDFYLVLPGITGVWQVSGRSDTTYEERVLMDSWYAHNWSVCIDIVYLLKTVLAVLKSKGAY